jgi:hypothetical protein
MLRRSLICSVWTSQLTLGNESNLAVLRGHGCTVKPEPPFANKAVIVSTLCVRIVCLGALSWLARHGQTIFVRHAVKTALSCTTPL